MHADHLQLVFNWHQVELICKPSGCVINWHMPNRIDLETIRVFLPGKLDLSQRRASRESIWQINLSICNWI